MNLQLAKERSVVVLLGSVPERTITKQQLQQQQQEQQPSDSGSGSPRRSKIHNTSILINRKVLLTQMTTNHTLSFDDYD